LESKIGKQLLSQILSNSYISGKRLSFAIVGSIEDIDKNKLDAIVALLQELGGDTTVKVLDVDEGSIKLILGGSSKALEKIEALFKTGELTDLFDSELGVRVEDIHFVEKQELVQLILKNGGEGLDFQRVDLSRTNLSGADLRGANLRGANLRGANLSGTYLIDANLSGTNLSRAYLSRANLSRAYLNRADLSGTVFGFNEGITEQDKADFRARGAIFVDDPNSEVPNFRRR
jgi:hypothetical protein